MCGDIEVFSTDVFIRMSEEMGWATYVFTCNECCCQVEKDADSSVVSLLKTAGVRVDTVSSEIFDYTNGVPLTSDDLLDFALWLRSTPNATVNDLVGDTTRPTST